jgi:octaprenyl-diphosphate synthase
VPTWVPAEPRWRELTKPAHNGGDLDSFRSRLCYTLVSDTLREVDIELIEIKSVRFLCDRPWIPGKRLRPITFLLANFSMQVERFGQVSANGRQSKVATAIELLHEASLVHDDLVDRSEMRRGTPTMQMQHGEGLALLIGDYLVFRGLKLVLDAAETRTDILLAQELANTGLQIAHGEADQLDRYLRRMDPGERMSMASYLDVIAKKTAAFFAGCAECGAALAGAGRQLRAVYREYGMNFGVYFQMSDDLMDVAGNPAVALKSLRNNLTEGTVTLPMIHALALYPGDARLQQLASTGTVDPAAQEDLYRILGSEPVIARCRETMETYFQKAQGLLAQMPVNIYRSGLADLLDYIRYCPWGGLGPALEGKRESRDGKRGRSAGRKGSAGKSKGRTDSEL